MRRQFHIKRLNVTDRKSFQSNVNYEMIRFDAENVWILFSGPAVVQFDATDSRQLHLDSLHFQDRKKHQIGP